MKPATVSLLVVGVFCLVVGYVELTVVSLFPWLFPSGVLADGHVWLSPVLWLGWMNLSLGAVFFFLGSWAWYAERD